MVGIGGTERYPHMGDSVQPMPALLKFLVFYVGKRDPQLPMADLFCLDPLSTDVPRGHEGLCLPD